ncbi:MAG: acetyl-CoA carboxylase biotin carboxylase subunit [Tatlockia sp.]|jgi:3-methylcrotonyl-CoA carboxylase alpha subunit
MFTKILIANRGEIACRIMKTAQNMGITCVAIYSTADKDSLHVQKADEAFWVGESPARDSYLHIDSIINVAKASGAQAIHPGYGFLSENPLFAKACEKAGLVFIGPSVSAMEAMASKQVAKQLLEKTQVPLTPGYHGSNQNEAHLQQEAVKMGFPLLLKAANGGGGKGMRQVQSESEFAEAMHAAKREALASFGDDTLIIEKLINNPRHIEVQIMADNHGNIVHLFERDCSIQRRHQKIIEEAPAPLLPASLRQQLLDAAVLVAKAIEYRGAGTVEFLVEDNTRFYFMEMNTRLQVEHPVTERITGLDLVAWQLQIAANEPLPLKQEAIRQEGHAIECRIYAEDPHQQFIPSIGQVHFLQEPGGEGIRIDSGVTQGCAISKYYDPMIAKLISSGTTREEAIHRLQRALGHYAIGGVKTNIPFLQAIIGSTRFREANFGTSFLSEEALTLKKPDPLLALFLAASFDYLQLISTTSDPLLLESFAWQMHLQSHWHWHYVLNDARCSVKITPIDSSSFLLEYEENSLKIITRLEGTRLFITQNEHTTPVQFDNQRESIHFYLPEGPLAVHRFTWQNSASETTSKKGQLLAPMPATVVAILKKKGDAVKEGDSLLVLEAMKMEHTIFAPKDGILAEFFYEVGAQVNEGAELLALKE